MPQLTERQQRLQADWLNQYYQDLNRIQDNLDRAENARPEYKQYLAGDKSKESAVAAVQRNEAEAKERLQQLRNNPEYKQLEAQGLINVEQKIGSLRGLTAQEQANQDAIARQADIERATKIGQEAGTLAPGQEAVSELNAPPKPIPGGGISGGSAETDGLSEGDLGAGGISGGNDYINELIKLDPFLAEQFGDEKTRAMFQNLPPELQSVYLQAVKSFTKKVESGQVINPDIELTPEILKQFTDQATAEIDPYYKEVLGGIKGDLDISFQRMQEDYDKSIGKTEERFKENLAIQAGNEAEQGTAFSSGRIQREQQAVTNQQRQLDDTSLGLARDVQDIGRQAERQIGSTELGGVIIPQFKTYQASTQGFMPSGTRSLFTPQGNMLGTIPKQRTVDLANRSSNLEEMYRTNRVLDLKPLS